jgi:hypothetical protein
MRSSLMRSPEGEALGNRSGRGVRLAGLPVGKGDYRLKRKSFRLSQFMQPQVCQSERRHVPKEVELCTQIRNRSVKPQLVRYKG